MGIHGKFELAFTDLAFELHLHRGPLLVRKRAEADVKIKDDIFPGVCGMQAATANI